MTNIEISERIMQAANTLNRLTVNGVDNARVVALIFDHLNETARIVREEGDSNDSTGQ